MNVELELTRAVEGGLHEYNLDSDADSDEHNDEEYEERSLIPSKPSKTTLPPSPNKSPAPTPERKEMSKDSATLYIYLTRLFYASFVVSIGIWLWYVNSQTPLPDSDPNPNSSPLLRGSSSGGAMPVSLLIENTPEQFIHSMAGCWRTCYTSSFATGSPATFLDGCTGDWLFVFSKDTNTDPGKIVVGAFVRRSTLLSPQVSNFTCDVPGGDCMLRGVGEPQQQQQQQQQGVYWYNQKSSNDYGYDSFGFSAQPNIRLTWSYGNIDVGDGVARCAPSTSWSLSDRTHAPSALNCLASTDARYRKVVMTNTCPVLDPIQ